ncbi:helix-turn-helix domain-containing protein [Mucilaginibacter ginsenosidivorans]|uniref:Helix-turn-helix transcriptional regulator n=1 Tax=Mucilaginibacter ginsenosidivorans TaxID=398053 RepID=A0A5B8USP0_9SPHI|nr:helix-turn-helix transcriptional regulator [Mucilaginibacter ginsenosidivorans]QEC61725.1 helix-turn-helix transcriptional regulator [Mucilaginibacter ginsenosidivorans]
MPAKRKEENVEAERELLIKLGAKFKLVREEKKLSLEKLGKIIGKDRQSIHRFERGEFNPSYLYLVELCKGLEINIGEILKEANNETL